MDKFSFKNIANLSIIVLIFSLLRCFFFYSSFNIPIKYFFNIQELTIQVSDSLIYITLIGVIGILIYGFLYTINSKRLEYFVYRRKRELQEINSRTDQAIFNKKLIKTCAIVFTTIPIWLCLLYIKYPNSENRYAIIGSLIISLYLIFLISTPLLHKSIPKEVKYSTLILVFYTSLLLLNTAIEINQVRNGKYSGTNIFTSRDTINTNTSILFVGKTENFTFLYDKKSKKSKIISSQIIEKIDLNINEPNYYLLWYKMNNK